MDKQTTMYRRPSDPGFLGSYRNWRSTILGFLLITLSSFVATEYIAKEFRFSPALGAPILRSGAIAVYEPFEWIAWGWRYCTSREPWIREQLFHGENDRIRRFRGYPAISFFLLANRRAQKLSENAVYIHGSARWASPDDIQATGLIAARRGVYVGGWRDTSSNHLHYLRHNGPEHVLAFAPTRSRRGVSLVIPTLLAWEESAVIYDIKGENWAKTAGFRASQGHLCFKFSPVEQNSSSRFTPLQEVRLFTPRDVSDAQNIASMIVRTGEDSPQERYWQDAAASITTGMILHVCYAAAVSKRGLELPALTGMTPGTSGAWSPRIHPNPQCPAYRGSVKKNVEPLPSSDSTQIRPPARLITRSQIARPMPVPGYVDELWRRLNNPKTNLW